MRLRVPPAALLSHFKFYWLRLHNFGVIRGRSVAKALLVNEGLVVHLVNSLLSCALFSLEPLAQNPRNEIMDLCRVNLFTPLPLPCSVPPGAYIWSSRRHSGLVVWAVYVFKITFRTGCKILFRQILRPGQRVPCWLHVLYLCYWQSVLLLFRDRDIRVYIFYHEASPKYLDLFCK